MVVEARVEGRANLGTRDSPRESIFDGGDELLLLLVDCVSSTRCECGCDRAQVVERDLQQSSFARVACADECVSRAFVDVACAEHRAKFGVGDMLFDRRTDRGFPRRHIPRGAVEPADDAVVPAVRATPRDLGRHLRTSDYDAPGARPVSWTTATGRRRSGPRRAWRSRSRSLNDGRYVLSYLACWSGHRRRHETLSSR